MVWMIWGLFIGLLIGFGLGKLASISRMSKWLDSLTPEDRRFVHDLMHAENRWRRNVEHDISLS